MIHINLKTPVLKLQLEKADIQSFCELVLNQFLNHKIEKLSDCGAVWLYNKLQSKTKQAKTTIKLPLEYALMLRTFCHQTTVHHELHKVAIYTIFIQLDKQMK
jgi:hypothetical protein